MFESPFGGEVLPPAATQDASEPTRCDGFIGFLVNANSPLKFVEWIPPRSIAHWIPGKQLGVRRDQAVQNDMVIFLDQALLYSSPPKIHRPHVKISCSYLTDHLIDC